MSIWDDALGDIDAYAEELNQAAPAIQRYTTWAVQALSELTAVACELSPSKLDQMEHTFGDGDSPRYGGVSSAFRCLRTYPELRRQTQGNIDWLRQLGHVPHGAGMAVVTQGVIHPHFAHKLRPLAVDWRNAGLPFPLAPFTIWSRHVPVLGGAA